MSTTTRGGIAIKLFIGCQINSEIRMHLNASEKWKQHQIHAQGKKFQELTFREKDYFGYLLEQDRLAIQEIRSLESRIRKELSDFCPELNVEEIHLHIIPQLFLS